MDAPVDWRKSCIKSVRSLALFMKTICLLVPLVLFLAGCATPVRDTSHSFHTVIIDAGHGGKDSGAHSRRGGMEKTATLDVALRLEPKLRAAGFNTVMTRRGDYFVELNDRAALSNAQRNAIFLSIHFNDSSRHAIYGIETYYHSAAALPLAERVERSLGQLAPARGVIHANFRVLRLNQYPAILVECGFLSNPREATRCATPQYHEALAERLAAAIIAQRSGN